MKSQIFTTKARAKINLTLHVGAAHVSGYHPLHSLVVFADIGDDLSLQLSDTETEPRLNISGTFASELPNNSDNLVLRACENFQSKDEAQPVFSLVKKLPIASGIGGGSADAAAAIRLLQDHMTAATYVEGQVPTHLGADIPVCLLSETCLMEGIGEHITPLPNLGQVAAVLVNPGVPVSTAAIFNAFDETGTSSEFQLSPGTLIEMAQGGQNDLQQTAINIEPIIQTVLDDIYTQDGCQLARMSGSGATCFGLFPDIKRARNALIALKAARPNWWCVQVMLGDLP